MSKWCYAYDQKHKKYYSEFLALNAMRKMRRNGMDPQKALNVFRCTDCKKWHVGNREWAEVDIAGEKW